MIHVRPRDSYLRRIAVVAAIAVALIIIAALVGPRTRPAILWYEHTGVEGEIQILDALSISRSDDPIDQNSVPELKDATRGVDPTLTEKIVQRDPLNPLPLESDPGEYGENLQQVEDHEAKQIVGEEPVELRGASQQSLTFVLLNVVNPAYPDNVAPELRQREVVVATHLYVNEHGIVEDAYVSRNDGGPAFENAVLDAVRQWKYAPVAIDGKPTGFWDTIYFVFRVGLGDRPTVQVDRNRGQNGS